MTTSTLLFAQQGIKAVILNEGTITVHYVDGGEPLYINEDDEMYSFHLANFKKVVSDNLNPPQESNVEVLPKK